MMVRCNLSVPAETDLYLAYTPAGVDLDELTPIASTCSTSQECSRPKRRLQLRQPISVGSGAAPRSGLLTTSSPSPPPGPSTLEARTNGPAPRAPASAWIIPFWRVDLGGGPGKQVNTAPVDHGVLYASRSMKVPCSFLYHPLWLPPPEQCPAWKPLARGPLTIKSAAWSPSSGRSPTREGLAGCATGSPHCWP